MLLSFLLAMGAAVRARAVRGLVYGQGAKLDVYAPIGADGEAPVVVFAHAGGRPGRRRLFSLIGQTLASRGFVTLVPDLSEAPDAFLDDIAAAAAFAMADSRRFGGDPDRLFLIGTAAGAGAVVGLALDPSCELRGAVGLCGRYGPAADAGAQTPPILLIAGGRGQAAASQADTARLAAALRQAGASVTEIRAPRLSDCVHNLFGVLRFRATVLDEIERFVRLHSLEIRG